VWAKARCPRLPVPALMTDVPEIAIAAVDLFPAGFNTNAVFLGVVKAVFRDFSAHSAMARSL